MPTNQKRCKLHFDIFEKSNQPALALPDLTPGELVAAILQEFRQDLEYLGDTPTDYQLLRADDLTPLDNANPLAGQLFNQPRLILVEQERPLPTGTQRPADHLYLREQTTGKVYKLHWLPALIGRPDPTHPHNEWLAVNLESYATGLRVSRRQAMVTVNNGRYYLESLSSNPTLIKDSQGNTTPVTDVGRPLSPGDTIYLERSHIALKFLMRPDETPPQAAEVS